MVVTAGKGEADFVENEWAGLNVEVVESLVLKVTAVPPLPGGQLQEAGMAA